jgi:hypothetical protein
MPRVVKLSPKIKKQKNIRCSPHVLNLKKEIEKKKEAEILEKRSDVQKVLDSTASKVKNFKQKIAKVPKCVKGGVISIKDAIGEMRLNLNFLRSKFKPDVSRLFAVRHENKKTRKQENKNVAPRGVGGFGGSKEIKKKLKEEIKKAKRQKINNLKKQKIRKSKSCKIIPEPESSSMTTPFYIFRLKNALANMLLFVLFVCVLVLPIRGFIYAQKLTAKKNKIISHASAAAEYLQEVKDSAVGADLELIKYQFNKAQSEFILARNEIEDINGLTKTLIKIIPRVGSSFTTGENILIMGEYLSKSGQYFAEIVDILQNNIAVAQRPTDKLEAVKDNLKLSLFQLQRAVWAGDEIDSSADGSDIPPEYQEEILKIKKYLPEVFEKTEKLINYIEVSQKILGHEGLKRYLFIFQNNNEIRATGGFAGSYALIDFNQGKVVNLEIPVGGSYDLEGGEQKNIVAPEPLQLINAHWHFWDANWFFDFPTSAEKLIEFYNSSGGPTVDGVVAINATFMQDIVGEIGEVKVSGFEQTINGKNFIELLQKEGDEHKFEKEPKKFLSAAGPEIIKQLINYPENFLKILPILNTGLKQKDLQFYFSSYDLQREVMDLGWSGRILDNSKDYLAVVHTNLGGGKTDQVIDNEIWHSAEIDENGEVVNTVVITRAHNGKRGDKFTGVASNDYLRVYVPLGSKLIRAHGFSTMPLEAFEIPEEGYMKDELIAEIEGSTEIDGLSGTRIFVESDKTVFGNWIHLEPGEVKSVYLKYRLPFVVAQNKPMEEDQTIWEQVKLAFNPKLQPRVSEFADYLNYYSLLVQKQSGISNSSFISRVSSVSNNSVQWSYPEGWGSDGGAQEFSCVLDDDMIEVLVWD